MKPTTKIEVLKIIGNMGNSTSAGNDRIDALAIKHGAAILHGPITHVVNTSIKTSTFATKWKVGKLLPLHKGKGLPKQDPKSFRPISMLPILGKITERVVQHQVMNFMEKSGQINQNHHSYRKLHSTVTTMLQISDTIFEGINENKIATIVTIDQSSAFDVINHEILKQKLKLYNFGGSALDWIESYLNFRSQFVSIGTRDSVYNNITSGVPQGSVLGPILYIIYVNELPAAVNDNDCRNEVHENEQKLFTDNCKSCGILPTYADDSTFVITTNNRFETQDKIVSMIEKIKTFLDSNSLAINLGKTEIVEIMVRQKRVRIRGPPPQLSVTKPDGTLKIIVAKESCKLLGANLNRDATWSHHLHTGEKPLLAACRSTLGAITHISHSLPTASRLLLANGLLISRILYLLPMWGGLNRREAKRIQVLLNKCARMVLGKSRRTRTRTLMVACKWLYFLELVKYHSLLIMWKLVHLNVPSHLRSKIVVTQDNLIESTEGRIQTSRMSFRWRTIEDWNDLNTDLRLEDSLRLFKLNLKKYIIDARPPDRPRLRPDNRD